MFFKLHKWPQIVQTSDIHSKKNQCQKLNFVPVASFELGGPTTTGWFTSVILTSTLSTCIVIQWLPENFGKFNQITRGGPQCRPSACYFTKSEHNHACLRRNFLISEYLLLRTTLNSYSRINVFFEVKIKVQYFLIFFGSTSNFMKVLMDFTRHSEVAIKTVSRYWILRVMNFPFVHRHLKCISAGKEKWL